MKMIRVLWALVFLGSLNFHAQEQVVSTQESTSNLNPGEKGGLETILAGMTLENCSTNALMKVISTIAKAPDWGSQSDSLSRWLRKMYHAQAVQKPGWMQLSGLQRWCEFFSEAKNSSVISDPSAVTWLLNDSSLTKDFFLVLSPKDKLPQVLSILNELHKAEPTRFPAYNRLAIAMALVWDAPPRRAPHGQVAADKLPIDESTIFDRFRFWVESNEKKICEYDLTKLEVEQLKFIVDATQPLDELRWAQTGVGYNRGNFSEAFSFIKYDKSRLDRGEYSWTHPVYSLKEIRKLGGICVDQAYFASVAGKAKGIPTLFFTGEGRRGGHAWFGYMKSPDRWVLDCGRYQYDKFATGNATDPQTREEISDHEIAFLAESFRNTPAYHESMAHLRQATLFQKAGDLPQASAAIETALKLSPMNLDAWEFKTGLLELDKNADAACKSHLNAMVTQFIRYPDVKADCQQKLAARFRESGDQQKAAMIEDRIVRDNRDKRHDLSVEVYENKLKECCAKQDWKGGRAVVHDAIMKLKDEKGSVFQLTSQFVSDCLKNGEIDEATRAVTDLKNRILFDEILSKEVEALQKEVKEASKEKRATQKK